MIERELIEEALQSAATVDDRYHGGHGHKAPATAGAKAVRSLRQKLKAFLEDLPGDATVEDLRDALEGRR